MRGKHLWIETARDMPMSGRSVLVVCVLDVSGRRLINRAMWVAAKTEECGPDYDLGEYDEETDTYYDPEGWYERVSHCDEYTSLFISGATVTHWAPLPELPET